MPSVLALIQTKNRGKGQREHSRERTEKRFPWRELILLSAFRGGWRCCRRALKDGPGRRETQISGVLAMPEKVTCYLGAGTRREGWVDLDCAPRVFRGRDAIVSCAQHASHTRKRTIMWLGHHRLCPKVPAGGVKGFWQEDKMCCLLLLPHPPPPTPQPPPPPTAMPQVTAEMESCL